MSEDWPTGWIELGAVDALRARPLQQLEVGGLALGLSYVVRAFAAIAGRCNHAGGPLGDGALDGDYIVCPWHHWKFHRATGLGEPGYEADAVPRYELREVAGALWARRAAASPRTI